MVEQSLALPERPFTTPVVRWIAISILAALLCWISMGDLLGRIDLGVASLNGVLTVVAATGCVAWVLGAVGVSLHRRRVGLNSLSLFPVPALLALSPFAAYVLTWLVAAPTAVGLQNVSTYLLLALAPLALSVLTRAAGVEGVLSAFRAIAFIFGLVGLVTFAMDLPVFGPRYYAIAALALMTGTIAAPIRGWHSRVAPYLLFAAIVFSQSRMATFVAIAVLGCVALFRARRGRKLVYTAITLLLAGAGAVAAIALSPTLKVRFVDENVASGDPHLGGIPLNTNGRTTIWNLLIAHISPDNALLGHGPGQAGMLVKSTYSGISHPHNEFLRIIYDFGAIGLLLLLAGAVLILVSALRRARHDSAWGAAIIAVVALASMALTDNSFVYATAVLTTTLVIAVATAGATRVRQPPDTLRSSAPPKSAH